MGWYSVRKMPGLPGLIGLGILLLAVLLAGCGGEAKSGGTGTTQTAPVIQASPTVDELGTLIAMQQVATEVPTVTPWPTYTPTALPTATLTPTATLAPTMTFTPEPTSTLLLYPTNTPRSTQVQLQTIAPPAEVALVSDPNAVADHYYFARPFPRDSSGQVIDYLSRSYPYGSTGGGQFKPHHGVDIPNVMGTDIHAVASGYVFYAGTDATQQFGPQTDFYGNLVVIQHDMPASNGQMLYSLYGHMSEIDVQTGQRVEMGEKIGEVGSSGVALGAHLHLEVRIADPYDYGSTYNPDLWVRPWPTFGTLAGTMLDRGGSRVYDTMITIRSVETGQEFYAYSYANDNVNSDPIMGENYARGDLPAGEYRVFVRIRNILRYDGTAIIQDGKTTRLDIQLR